MKVNRLSGRLARLALGALVAGLSLVVTAGTAQAQGGYRFLAFADKCVDVYGANTGNDVPIIQWTCNGQANQRFEIRDAGNGLVEIHTFANKCLDVRGANDGDGVPIIQYQCTGNYNQRFRIAAVGNGQFEFHTFADKCFDVYGGSSDDGKNIIQYHCTGQFNQKFRIN